MVKFEKPVGMRGFWVAWFMEFVAKWAAIAVLLWLAYLLVMNYIGRG